MSLANKLKAIILISGVFDMSKMPSIFEHAQEPLVLDTQKVYSLVKTKDKCPRHKCRGILFALITITPTPGNPSAGTITLKYWFKSGCTFVYTLKKFARPAVQCGDFDWVAQLKATHTALWDGCKNYCAQDLIPEICTKLEGMIGGSGSWEDALEKEVKEEVCPKHEKTKTECPEGDAWSSADPQPEATCSPYPPEDKPEQSWSTTITCERLVDAKCKKPTKTAMIGTYEEVSGLA